MVGPVITNDGKLQIATKTSGTVEAPKEEVTLIRNDAEQPAYEKSLHPGLLHGWTAESTSVSQLLAAIVRQETWRSLSMPYIQNSIQDHALCHCRRHQERSHHSPTVANLSQGGFRYDRDLDSWNFFVFGAADFMANAAIP